ncbi:MAG: molybdenum cofactor guanylyltransferase [Thermodesulfobacteriota bacterium]
MFLKEMTGAVLVGGKSRRMGFNKAFIEINGQSIVERVVETLHKSFTHLIVITNRETILDYERLNVRVVADIYDGAGSIGGIYTALFHSPSPYCFVAACDMPLLDRGVIEKMVREAKGHDAVIPCINGRFHPLHAIYSRRCMGPMEEMIQRHDLTIGNLYRRIKVRRLEEDFFPGAPDFPFLSNINTAEELKRLSQVMKTEDVPHREGKTGKGCS